MARHPTYTRDLLTRTAADSTSLVDMLRRLDAPLGSGPRRYLRDRLKHHGVDTTHFVDEALPPHQRRAYTRALLGEAAAQSHSIREMLEYMEVPPYDSAYTHLYRKLEQFGIDTSHFTRRGRGSVLLPRRQLEVAVVASQSLAGVLAHLGRTDNSTSRRALKRSIEAYGLSTEHFTGQGHRRGLPSPARKSADNILRQREPGSRREKTVFLRRALNEKKVSRQCSECSLGDTWQGKRLVLEIDHINGDRLDNRLENLRYLCPSCHSQTRTFSCRSAHPAIPAQPRARAQ
ncbi:HNH endonuclease signature motif containing protein [Streptomyces sp. NEAU-S7GS2]|uniref:HNH endonuclease signature motif containing protein n=1 Tax=Streptomyces sp. NEAU-S7GS2 TaxID=2202000 RepID=UPI000D6F43F0|nr:HNH endonuclease signature motif containing protein [Streptomyces sp. NEAU-S7GS2]AWN27447.1 HNH endonuclease [Streptomyces sp. NEAU-S7GS2]